MCLYNIQYASGPSHPLCLQSLRGDTAHPPIMGRCSGGVFKFSEWAGSQVLSVHRPFHPSGSRGRHRHIQYREDSWVPPCTKWPFSMSIPDCTVKVSSKRVAGKCRAKPDKNECTRQPIRTPEKKKRTFSKLEINQELITIRALAAHSRQTRILPRNSRSRSVWLALCHSPFPGTT